MPGSVVKLESLGDIMLTWTLGGEPTIESYQLARILGYVQWSSLRKQTLTDWRNRMKAGTDYYMIKDETEMRLYEKEMEHHGQPCSVVDPSRGYLMFTGAGVAKILERTKKVNGRVFRSDAKLVFHELDTSYEFVAPDDLAVDITAITPKPPAPKPEISTEDRKFQYEVLQTLLKQLQEFDDVAMREVAISAAEAATGKDFSDLRKLYAVKTIMEAVRPAPPASKPAPEPIKMGPGPVFTEEGFYSLKAIGEKAGGYAPATAGKAANIVANRMGYSPEQIRRTQLSFNQLPILRDTNGKPRQMFRFGKEFANAVITELRNNNRFRPTPMPTVSSFSAGADQHVSLTAPLNLNDDEGTDEEEGDEGLSDNMSSFLTTLQGGKH